jgi:hypothetical protein
MAPRREGAILLYPGTTAYGDKRFPVGRVHVADANRHKDRYRVGCFVQVPAAVLAGRLRHELEHARQHRAHGQRLFDLQALLIDVVALRFGGRPGGADVYNLMPLEHDANAAAARYVARRHGDEAETLLAAGYRASGLFRSLTGPEAVETLPARTVSFAYLYVDLCERYAAGRDTSFGELLDGSWPGAGDLWERLRKLGLGRWAGQPG